MILRKLSHSEINSGLILLHRCCGKTLLKVPLFTIKVNARFSTSEVLKNVLRIVKTNPLQLNNLSYRTENYTSRNFSNFFSKNKYSFAVKEEKSFLRHNKNGIKRLLKLALPEKWKIAGAIILLLISSTVTIAVPFSLGRVIDIIQIEDPAIMKDKLKKLSAVLVGLFLIGSSANFGRVYLISLAGQKMTQSLRQKLYTSIMRQELAFFDNTKTGDLVNRLAADTLIVCQSLTKNISDGLRSGLMVLGGISIMLYMSSELALVGLSIVPPIAGLAIMYGRFVRKMTKEVQNSLASASCAAEEKMSNIRTVKAFSNEVREIEYYEKMLHHALNLQNKEALAKGVFFGLTGLSGNLITLTVLFYGGTLVSENTMTVGNLTSFLLYAAYIGISISGLSSFYTELNKSLGASVKLWEIIDRSPLIPPFGGVIPEKDLKGFIAFRNVTFSYPTRKGDPVLKNLTLDIPEATITAIVGHSGSGKSTIASLLLRLYDPDDGKIFLDGMNIQDVCPDWLRKHIGYVSQEPVLFSGSIRENILYGAVNPSTVTNHQIIRATQEANCFDFIAKNFSQGFETQVGERGVMLSGGQKQRIAIARALLRNPKILLLDEATSALDAESEHLVQEALEKIMKGRTVLVIAHRLSSIKSSDQIVVLEKGEAVEMGNYHYLIAKEGPFKKLIKHQTFI